ncbi:MAG: outer membrane beta-barrel protein [Prolixibacteraceae bacterium]|nr:outer membrane beta-barrel protein [Prolixibacteraceae bacterium]
MRCLFSLLLLLFLCNSVLYSQKITIGIENGINFSNIFGDIKNGKWDSETGSVNGIYSQFNISDWLAFQTGTSYISCYYNKYSKYYYYTDYFASSYADLYSSIAPSSHYYYSSSGWNFNFLRIPFFMKFKTPGRLSFAMGGGPYYSFLVNDEFTGKNRNLYEEDYDEDNFPENHDWGWMLNSSLSYSFNSNIEIRLSAQTSKGKKTFLEDYEGKNGSTEFTLGIGYNIGASKENGFSKKMNNDSTKTRVEILPFSGIVISRTSNPDYRKKYLGSTGSTAGVLVKMALDNTVSFVTGALYERKGYHLEKFGNTDFLYIPSEDEITSKFIDTNTELDYLTFPFLFDLKFGKQLILHVNFGAYYSLLQNVIVRGNNTQTNTGNTSYSVERTYIYYKNTGWFKDKDAGVLAGFRFEYPLFSFSNIFIGANFTKGFKNVLDYDPKEYRLFGEGQEIFNTSCSIMFGLTFSTFKTFVK